MHMNAWCKGKDMKNTVTNNIPSVVTDKSGKKHIIPALWDENRSRISWTNGKTGIPSVNLLAGDGEYDGYTPEVLKGLPSACGSCGCNCDGCYAKKMTRYIDVFIKFYLNTLEAKEDPERFVSLIEKELFSGHFLTHPRIVRFHDSGDMVSYDYLVALMGMSVRHPYTQFGTYTKQEEIMHQYGLDNIPQNVVISCSPWEGYCQPIGDLPQFIYDDHTNPEIASLPHCPAVTKEGKRTGVQCIQCLHCYTAKRGDRWAVHAH